MLDPAGPAALSAALLWWGMFVFFTLVFLFVCGFWFYAMMPRSRALKKSEVDKMSRRLIIGGGIIFPGVSIFVILLFGIPMGHGMLPLAVPGQKVLRINVTGHQWYWEMEYPDFGIKLKNELHLPLGQLVDIHTTSADVIHSFWVPRLNGKMDAIPGHTNILRLQASKGGHFRGQCAEFCGLWHANMVFAVDVHTQDAFEGWVKKQQGMASDSDTR